jgi:hypothetical protein
VEDIKGNRGGTRDVLLAGEFLSLGIPDRDIRSIQVEIKGQGQIGLLASWLRPGDDL